MLDIIADISTYIILFLGIGFVVRWLIYGIAVSSLRQIVQRIDRTGLSAHYHGKRPRLSYLAAFSSYILVLLSIPGLCAILAVPVFIYLDESGSSKIYIHIYLQFIGFTIVMLLLDKLVTHTIRQKLGIPKSWRNWYL